MRLKILILAIAISLLGCNYPNEFGETSITVGPIERIYATAAVVQGSIKTGMSIAEFGVCWNTYSNPSVEYNNHMAANGELGNFSVMITSLHSNSDYYIRVYAKLHNGNVLYSTNIEITTKQAGEDLPDLAGKVEIRDKKASSVELSCSVAQPNDLTITERGFCWSDNGYTPFIDGNKIICGSGAGSFSGTFSGLTSGKNYKVRAYAINAIGVNYSDVSTFSVNKSDFMPVLSSAPTLVSKGFKEATISATISSDNGYPITDRGFCWGKSYNVSKADNFISCLSGSGPFSGTIKPLNVDTYYYVKAYATNEIGTTYSASYITLTVNSADFIPIFGSNFTLSSTSPFSPEFTATVSSASGIEITERGFCYVASSYGTPVITDKVVKYGKGAGEFKGKIAPAADGAYRVRAYAINGAGVAYSQSIITATIQRSAYLAKFTSSPNIESQKPSSLTLSATISTDEGYAVTERGFCWTTSGYYPTVDDDKLSCNSGTGKFIGAINNLAPDYYYIRAYAINEAGVSYSAARSVRINN